MNTPYYVVDELELANSFNGFARALNNHFKSYIPSYSVKTNSLPYVIKKAKEMRYFAEVVSDDEYELALRCGFDKNKIIFNGPLKSRDAFLDAVSGKALVNIETFREIEWLKLLPRDSRYKVGIRMNVNISLISPCDENHESDNSRFGFSCESGDFDTALKQLAEIPNITLDRLHIHRTSKTRSVSFYCNLVNYAMSQLQKRRMVVSQIDLGGGFFGMMPGKPSYDEYAKAIKRVLSSYCDIQKTTIIIEPGNAIVASCFSFYSSVVDVKQHDGTIFVTLDGSRIDIDPFFRKSNYFFDLKKKIHKNIAKVPSQVVGGCTCLEYDRLMELADFPKLELGDVLCFNRVGAYTMALTPLFIRYWPAVYVNDGHSLKLVREKFDVRKIL